MPGWLTIVFLGLAIWRPCEGLEGGRPARPDEYRFLASIEWNGLRLCLGVIISPSVVATTDECWKGRRDLSKVEVVPLAYAQTGVKWYGWFMASNTDIGDVHESKLGIAVVYLSPNVLEFVPNQASTWSDSSEGTFQATVVGSDLKIGAMDVVKWSECVGRMNLTNSMLASGLLCAVKRSSTKSLDDVPPGHFCTQDIGAPLFHKGAVIGILLRAACSYVDDVQRAVFQEFKFTKDRTDDGKKPRSTTTTTDRPEKVTEPLVAKRSGPPPAPFFSERSISRRHRRMVTDMSSTEAVNESYDDTKVFDLPIGNHTLQPMCPDTTICSTPRPAIGTVYFPRSIEEDSPMELASSETIDTSTPESYSQLVIHINDIRSNGIRFSQSIFFLLVPIVQHFC